MLKLESDNGDCIVKAAGTTETIAADACIAITGLVKSMWDTGEEVGKNFELFLLAGLPMAISAAREKHESEKGGEK